MIHLDTHVVAGLYEGRLELIPSAVAKLLEQNEICVSPMVQLEFEYLFRSAEPASGASWFSTTSLPESGSSEAAQVYLRSSGSRASSPGPGTRSIESS
jgi:hypothetical protein